MQWVHLQLDVNYFDGLHFSLLIYLYYLFCFWSNSEPYWNGLLNFRSLSENYVAVIGLEPHTNGYRNAKTKYLNLQTKYNFVAFLVLLGSECNHSRLTFDGVDRMGERLAEEVFC